MYCTGCGASLPSGAMFCPSCGRRVGSDPGQPGGGSVPSSTGFTPQTQTFAPSFGFKGRTAVTIQFPREAAKVGGTFRYFAVKIDGREQPTDYGLGERIVFDVDGGTHRFEIRQVNQAVMGGIAKLEFTREIRGGEVFDIEVVNRQLRLRSDGQAGTAPASSTSSDSDRRWY